MTYNNANRLRIEEIHTNPDGSIEQTETYGLVSGDTGYHSSSYESSTHGLNYYDDTNNGFGRNRYASNRNQAVSSDFNDETAIQTSSSEETNEYLRKAAGDIYNDPNPQTIRGAAPGGAPAYEQRIVVRYLQPPSVPEPGPLIIEEVRPPQAQPPRALVIRQHAPAPLAPPPLILRERPPTPPPYIPEERTTRLLSAIPVPPRSLVIQRFPPPPEKPRDILIERWIPYGPQPERRTIVRPAPRAISYPEPRNQIIVYERAEARVVRQFKKLGITKGNPDDYVAEFGTSLLDPATLVQMARDAGVHEDISPPVLSSSMYSSVRENRNTAYYDPSNGRNSRDYPFSD